MTLMDSLRLPLSSPSLLNSFVFLSSNWCFPHFNSLFFSRLPPFFLNRCYYEEDASVLNTNPSFDAVLKDYSDAWAFPGIKIAWRSVSVSNKAFSQMACHKETEEPCSGLYCLRNHKNRPHSASYDQSHCLPEASSEPIWQQKHSHCTMTP